MSKMTLPLFAALFCGSLVAFSGPTVAADVAGDIQSIRVALDDIKSIPMVVNLQDNESIYRLKEAVIEDMGAFGYALSELIDVLPDGARKAVVVGANDKLVAYQSSLHQFSYNYDYPDDNYVQLVMDIQQLIIDKEPDIRQIVDELLA